MLLIDSYTILSGIVVGFVLALVGGGGSILAVPMLIYGVGIASPHMAIGTSAVAVAASALFNFFAHLRAGNVKWRCGAVFTAAGIMGTFAGSTAAKSIDGQNLLSLFAVLMVAMGFIMFRKRNQTGDPSVQLNRVTARALMPKLVGLGFGAGLLSGFFGIGGGFLIVPGLMLATGMTLQYAIGTSLIAVSAFGATTAINYAVSGLVNWHIALVFIAGGILGGIAGSKLSAVLAKQKGALGTLLAAVIIAVGFYILSKSPRLAALL